MGWCTALLIHIGVSGILADDADRNVWILLRDKMDAEGQRVVWRDLGAEREDADLDLPVDRTYIERLRSLGVEVRARSRWLNAISARVSPDVQLTVLAQDFVREVRPVRRMRRPAPPETAPILPLANGKEMRTQSAQQDLYGASFEQVAQIGVIPLHDRGFTGTGVRIAVLDNGFHYVEHEGFGEKFRLVAQRDFVNGDKVVSDEVDQPVSGDEAQNSQNIHGAQVLSLLAAYQPGRFIGVAPDAEYILAKTEDNQTELPVEEDRWIAGLEWADSLGAKIVNSSLGYNIWDDGSGYAREDLDGATALTSRAAALAVRRGIVVVVAAGNEAQVAWHYITAPADAEGVIAVGSVDVPVGGVRAPEIAVSSSRGPTADGRIKPDVVAPGNGVVVANLRRGDYMRNTGTSFAAPLVSGVCALLLQMHPEWGPAEVLEALRSTALDLGEAGPDTVYGWGQVNALAASGLEVVPPGEHALLSPFPNPASNGLVHFPVQLAERDEVELSVFDLAGNLIFTESWQLLAGVHDRPGRAPRWAPGGVIADGLYYYRMRTSDFTRSGKVALLRRAP